MIGAVYLTRNKQMKSSEKFERKLSWTILKTFAFNYYVDSSTHLLSLEALLTVTDSIEKNCHQRIANNGKIQPTEAVENENKTHVISSPGNDTVLKGSGHLAGKATLQGDYQHDDEDDEDKNLTKPTEMMSHEELMALKYKKKLITTATEQFNAKPAKGVSYLQEVGLVS